MTPSRQIIARNWRPIRAAAPWAALAFAAGLWLLGCAGNDPFDPESVPNSPPIARIFAEPIDPQSELGSTSWFGAKFSWSGTDRDGWVTEYYVSIRTDAAVPAPWDTTSRTDTTMTFATDDEGLAEATLLVACRDDRGALSDTVSRYFPIRNFPPEVAFQADFDPLTNMQRDVIEGSGATPDTVFWNFGICNFRCSARDPDQAETLEPFYRYTLVDGEPDRTWDVNDPAADPETGWIQVPFGPGEIKEFEIRLENVSPGPRTLTVSVRDEGLSDTRLRYSWEVRAPRGPVIWIGDNTPTAGRTFFREMLDATFGSGNWDTYEFRYGFPDREYVLLESLRLFDVVIWSDGGTTSPTLQRAAARDGVLEQYVIPRDGQDAGRLMMVSRSVTGPESLVPTVFRSTVLKLSSSSSPGVTLQRFAGLQVLGDEAWLPTLTSTSDFAKAIGLKPNEGCEAIYRFEECCGGGCFGIPRPNPNDPCDPVVVARWPERISDPLARVISVGLQPQSDHYTLDETIAAFGALLTIEMGAAIP